MKFYFVYEQAFPLGFGLAAIICIATGLFGFYWRRPFVHPFVITLLVYVGALVPLFMLSLNHFWVAWPLGLGTLLLNGFGLVSTTGIIFALWVYKFEHTALGVGREAVLSALRERFPGAEEGAFRVFSCCFNSVCYIRTTLNEPGTEVRRALTASFREKNLPMNYTGLLLSLLLGAICATTAGISWCVSTQCLGRFS